MKNIKFKAKALNSGEWVVGDLLHRVTDTCIAVKDMDDIVYYPVDHATVCQFTGLKDCEDNDIWEHDLLLSKSSKAIYEVVWNEGGFTIRDYVIGADTMVFLCSALRTSRIKVIGNKFDKEK